MLYPKKGRGQPGNTFRLGVSHVPPKNVYIPCPNCHDAVLDDTQLHRLWCTARQLEMQLTEVKERLRRQLQQIAQLQTANDVLLQSNQYLFKWYRPPPAELLEGDEGIGFGAEFDAHE